MHLSRTVSEINREKTHKLFLSDVHNASVEEDFTVKFCNSGWHKIAMIALYCRW